MSEPKSKAEDEPRRRRALKPCLPDLALLRRVPDLALPRRANRAALYQTQPCLCLATPPGRDSATFGMVVILIKLPRLEPVIAHHFIIDTIAIARRPHGREPRVSTGQRLALSPHRHLDTGDAWQASHLARFHTVSIVMPGVSRLLSDISSAVMDLMIRRKSAAPAKFGNVLVAMLAWIVFVFSSTVYVPV